MKSRDILRAVRAQRFERSAGDAPILGRVTRMPRVSSKGRRRRSGQGGDSKRGLTKRSRTKRQRRKVVLVWSAVFALVSLATLATFIWLWVRKSNVHASAGGDAAVPPIEKRVVSQFESPSEDEAIDLVKRAMLLRDEESVLRYFRPGSASAAEIVDFLRTMHQTDGEVARYDWLSSMDANGLLIDGVMVETSVNSAARNRLALMTPDEEGHWKIDFEAFARVVKPSWVELLEKGAGRGVVRVIVAEDSYYNGPFLDDEVWVCYGMASPDADAVLTGYCKRDSPQAAAMKRIMSRSDNPEAGPKLKRAILEITRVPEAGPKQFEISRVLAEDWVMAGVAFDEGIR